MIINKVMLACAGKIESLPKELLEHGLMSPKIDGIRCHIEEVNGVKVAMSRANKPIPNRHFQRMAQNLPLGLDGELTVGEPCASDVFRKTTSALMSQDGEPSFRFNVFDEGCSEDGTDMKGRPFAERYADVMDRVSKIPEIYVVPQRMVKTMDRLLQYEENMLNRGYEGIMIRHANAKYKEGRATIREMGLVKIKRFVDEEAEIIECEELMVNQNEQKRDELGYAKRSSSKAGLVNGGTLGAVKVRDSQGRVFSIGSGFDAAERDRLWKMKDRLIGQMVKYKHFPVGEKELPRFPIYIGLRSKLDM